MDNLNVIRILAVDDHEMTTLGYKYILEAEDFDGAQVHMDIANTYFAGKEKMELAAKSLKYDIIFLDVQLFSSDDSQKETGEDLGLFARKILPESKIVFMSSYSDSFRINSILNNVDPDGYMVKSDIDPKSLKDLVRTITCGSPYYSSKALTAIRKKLANNIVLDDVDLKILQLLDKGVKTKDMMEYVSLSLPTVENRKRDLKSAFGVEKQNDLALLFEARKRGFI